MPRVIPGISPPNLETAPVLHLLLSLKGNVVQVGSQRASKVSLVNEHQTPAGG